ncbi:hypothetical protein NLU13_0252 [Sarocladium strictum]|uniref:Zn(2)-C6 fungal-type domain-containing protein n=1 Tax=Sarocladium strictum TaxID=5046 RepID=A0AA39GPH9_SARSR|nr:hypothetical protein NLU13_0252 [Sarocladium strictum]
MATRIEETSQSRITTKRRQNRSCDQCRQSKRACDASVLPESLAGESNFPPEHRLPCTYCAKTRKKCTMVKTDMHTRSAWKMPRQRRASKASASHHSASFDSNTPVDALAPVHQGYSPESGSSSDMEQWRWAEWHRFNIATCEETFDQLPVDDVYNGVGFLDDGLLPIGDTSPSDDLTQDLPPGIDAAVSSEGSDCVASDIFTAESSRESGRVRYSMAENDHLGHASTVNTSHFQGSSWGQNHGALSPFSIDQRVSASFHREMTSSNLMQIYHDVLEHHLSCWLAEMTCPYRQSSESAAVVRATPEWGTAWTNRILQRTVRLDKVAQSCKLIFMTRSEQKAASNALHSAVLAFATQWAQGSVRSRRRYSTTSQEFSHSGMAPDSMEEFDRTLQHHFWSQTHRALEKVTEIDCYQVACAEIIFSLAQRPWKSRPPGESGFETPSAHSIRAQVQSIIEKDGPPIYSERAARRLHILKFRCDSYQKGLGLKNRNVDHGIASMAREDRDTIGLLYWLAIMFDTVAASMYERPVVVVDEECRYEVQRDLSTFRDTNRPYRWDYEIFMQRSGEITNRTYWPCSYERAAEDVTKSAPVKVLLFRHVSYLQNALRQSAPAHQIEDIIFNTMLIYDYWNRTHGAFFKELVQDFSNVPQRIRGWFICISAHWHLAALLLADLLEFVDENNCGLQGAKHERKALSVSAKLRDDSCGELSDLGNVATLPTYLAMPQDSPEFHHAVTEGTILTEPWTMILIRAFSKASLFFLDRAETLCETRNTLSFIREFKQDLQKAENCIKVLWLLGKKSDMAWELAETLQQAMRRLQNGFVWHVMRSEKIGET